MNDNKLINEKYEQVNEFAFPSRGGHFTTDFEIAQDICMHADRIEGLVNMKQLTNKSKRLQQILIDIENFADSLEGQINSPDRVSRVSPL